VQAGLVVPAVGYEEHVWQAEPDGMSGRARRAAASGPYRSCVPARLRDYAPTLPSPLAADLEEAAASLAEFDAVAASALGASAAAGGRQGLLGEPRGAVTAPPAGAALSIPLGAILLRTESASSSQIEQLTVGARQLALAEIDHSTSANARAVIGNVKAMEQALAWRGPISQEAVLAIHRALLGRQPGWERTAGSYRRQLVWIGHTSLLGPRGASHVAPQANLIPAAMADLVEFMARSDLPAVLHAAVAHAQFETIHPFADGNGRVGRALVHVMLRQAGLVKHIAAPLSAGLLTDTEGYFAALGEFRRGAALPIVERFADASRFAAYGGRQLMAALTAQLDHDRSRLAGLPPQAVAWRVLPWLAAHPVINARLLVDELGLTDVAAQRAVAQLTRAGILTERTGLRRHRIWQHDSILGLLDDYAASLRRQ